MRILFWTKIIEHISLDGVIQHSDEDANFPYSDWTVPYRTPAGRDAVMAAYGEKFDLLLGRRTYDIWSGFWPKAPGSPIADGLNAATKYAATHRPESLPRGTFESVGPDLTGRSGPDLIGEFHADIDAAKAMPSGIVISHYQVAGPLKTV